MSRPQGFINNIGGFAIGKNDRFAGYSCAVRADEYLVVAGIRCALGTPYLRYRGSVSVMVQTMLQIRNSLCRGNRRSAL